MEMDLKPHHDQTEKYTQYPLVYKHFANIAFHIDF